MGKCFTGVVQRVMCKQEVEGNGKKLRKHGVKLGFKRVNINLKRRTVFTTTAVDVHSVAQWLAQTLNSTFLADFISFGLSRLSFEN